MDECENINRIFDEFVRKVPTNQNDFEDADELWSALQDNLENFINNPLNGGSTQKQTPQIKRPNWETIKDVLNGDKPISDLGCN